MQSQHQIQPWSYCPNTSTIVAVHLLMHRGKDLSDNAHLLLAFTFLWCLAMQSATLKEFPSLWIKFTMSN